MRAFALLLSLSACTCSPAPVPIGPEPEPDAGVDGGSSEGGGGAGISRGSACERACANLDRLGCEEAKPTKKGTTCTEVCEDAAAEGIDLGNRCTARAKTCDEARRCR